LTEIKHSGFLSHHSDRDKTLSLPERTKAAGG
jgi:hypothetical protein